jgi:hypothetical protein
LSLTRPGQYPWRAIPGAPGYEFHPAGRVRSWWSFSKHERRLDAPRELAVSPGCSAVPRVTLTVAGRRTSWTLAAIARRVESGEEAHAA